MKPHPIIPIRPWKRWTALFLPCLGKRITCPLALMVLPFCGWSNPAVAQQAAATPSAPATPAAPAFLEVPKPEPLNIPPIPEKFVHPGLFSSMEELQFIKKKIAAGEEPWKSAFEQMQNTKFASLTYTPKPHVTVSSGFLGKGAEAGGVADMSTDCEAAYTQALMWIFTDNEQYAQNAVKILNAWNILRSHAGPNWYLQASWSGAQFAEAADLVKATYPKWKPEDIAKFSDMLNKAFLPVLHNQMAYGNREFSTIYAMMAIGVFNDDRGAFYEGLSHFVSYLPCYIYLKEDGPTPKIANYWLSSPSDDELAKMDSGLFPDVKQSWIYTDQTTLTKEIKHKLGNDQGGLEKPTIDRLWNAAPPEAYVDGICSETFRDLGHSEMSLSSIGHVCELARHQGIDLYTPNAKRITRFMELDAFLRVGVPVQPCFYRVVPSGMGATWEVGYNYFHNCKGIDLPNTRIVLDKVVRPCSKTPYTLAGWYPVIKIDLPGVRTDQIAGFPGWETLTHGDLDTK